MRTSRRPAFGGAPRAHTTRSIVVAMAALVCLGSSCAGRGSDEPDEAVDSTTTISTTTTSMVPTVESVRADTAAAMARIDTVLFTVERTGGEVSIDDGGLLVFSSADARYASPDAADAVVSVSVGGNTIEIGAVAIGGRLWLTNPVSGSWEDATGTVEFDPAKIFDPTTGIAAILADGLTDASLIDDDPGRLHLSATVAAADVTTLTSGLVTEEATADVWIDPATMLVEEIRFDTPVDAGIATWSVTLSDYGSDVSVVEPDTGDGG